MVGRLVYNIPEEKGDKDNLADNALNNVAYEESDDADVDTAAADDNVVVAAGAGAGAGAGAVLYVDDKVVVSVAVVAVVGTDADADTDAGVDKIYVGVLDFGADDNTKHDCIHPCHKNVTRKVYRVERIVDVTEENTARVRETYQSPTNRTLVGSPDSNNSSGLEES
ncbi:hypothetical protein M0804_000461 [Polistes exclamans]|nr:hypothetical protein M0804_000461 [Polistes exclamans]